MYRAIFILGPTGVGKSEFAVKIAQLFNGEIISADSVQIYKGLDIGSAKIKKDEMQGIIHHAIDILEPNQNFSVFDFVEMTKKLIHDISSRGKLPIIVGGTALYVKALMEGYDFGGKEKESTFREKLWHIDNSELMDMLKKYDPIKASKVEMNDKKKLIRYIELAKYGKEPGKSETDIDFFAFALVLDRNILYERINSRVDKMIELGLIDEVNNLKQRGFNIENQSMKAIGYKETLDYLDGKISIDELISLIKQHTRNYAKRQMTFLRGMKIKMFDRYAEHDIISKVEEWYGNKND